MFVRIWAFQPQAGREAEFEQAYGAHGAWDALFARAAGYCGTELLRDAAVPDRYITLDRWESGSAFASFLARWKAEYDTLDQELTKLTTEEISLGDYNTMVDG